MNNYRILITGANGFTGQHACTYFLNAGYSVYAVVRNNSDNLDDAIHVVQCDLTNKKYVKAMIEIVQPHFVLHLAGQSDVQRSWEDPMTSIESNVFTTAYLIDALRQYCGQAKTIVVGSAIHFNPNVISSIPHPYSFSKTIQMFVAQAYESLYKMDIMIAKPSNLIGPGISTDEYSMFAEKVAKMEVGKAEKILEVNNLLTPQDCLDVRDAITAYETIFLRGQKGEVYDICSEQFHVLKDFVQELEGIAKVDFKVNAKSEVVEKFHKISSAKLRNLGWEPTITFDESIKDILDYHRDRHKGE